MQFPYPTAALIATPLRTTYLSLRTAIVLPAMPIRSACHAPPPACHALHSTYYANHPAERTDPASIHHIRTAARTDPASCSDNCATTRTDRTSIHPIRTAERTEPTSRYDFDTN